MIRSTCSFRPRPSAGQRSVDPYVGICTALAELQKDGRTNAAARSSARDSCRKRPQRVSLCTHKKDRHARTRRRLHRYGAQDLTGLVSADDAESLRTVRRRSPWAWWRRREGDLRPQPRSPLDELRPRVRGRPEAVSTPLRWLWAGRRLQDHSHTRVKPHIEQLEDYVSLPASEYTGFRGVGSPLNIRCG